MELNGNFTNLSENYLFAEIASRTEAYALAHPGKRIIKLGIGDVTLPLAPAVIEAMHEAVDEMSRKETFKGYGPYEGYGFLRESIKKYYKSLGAQVDEDEIFISDGSKSDLGNILDLFSGDNTVLIPDPVYPVYADTNLMAGRRIIYAKADEGNGFLPMPDYSKRADIIYICSPNNPTGATYSKSQLKEWVDYAQSTGAVILYDSAYSCFIADKDTPRSIFAVDGSENCAVEFCSFSKFAGFTGVRCGYSVVPKGIVRNGFSLNKMWYRRQATKFNGVSYIVQRGALAVFTEKGYAQIEENLKVYRRNAKLIAELLDRHGIFYTGGKNSPYIWLKCPFGLKSWQFFDLLLNNAQVVGTPGVGFGESGEGFFRLTAFSSTDNTKEAVTRIEKILQ